MQKITLQVSDTSGRMLWDPCFPGRQRGRMGEREEGREGGGKEEERKEWREERKKERRDGGRDRGRERGREGGADRWTGPVQCLNHFEDSISKFPLQQAHTPLL